MIGFESGSWPQQISVGPDRVGFISYAVKNDMIACGVDTGGDERFQIEIIENGGEKLGLVTHEPGVIHNWGAWSPDERSVCYSSNLRDASYFDIFTYSLDIGDQDIVHQHDSTNYPVAWSPDGKSLLFVREHAPFNQDLFLLNLADRSAELITPHEGDVVYQSASFDPTGRSVYCVTDKDRDFTGLAQIDLKDKSQRYLFSADMDVESVSVGRDGQNVAFTVNEGGFSRLMLTSSRLDDRPETVVLPPSVVGGLKWSNGGGQLAFSLTSPKLTADIWLYDLKTKTSRQLTHSSTCGLQESDFSDAQLFRFRSFDGLEVPAFIYRAKRAEPGPLLVYIHGGPESQFRPGFNALIQYAVHLGFSVLAPNVRGSTGYGRRYTHLDDVTLRMDSVKDVISAVEASKAVVNVDPRKIVAWGGSYGGFMVLACLYSEPDLWAAGVDIVGISNFVTFLRNTGAWRRRLRIPEYGDPEKDKDFLEKISPNNNAHLIKAPLFIIHGVHDPRVPIGEATQIMQTMEDLGREAHLVTFEDEGHGLVKLQNRIDGYSNALGFVMHRVTLAGLAPSPSTKRD
jgi:dipeptidyl aminopeptidase/acylaminoacyl peptidase